MDTNTPPKIDPTLMKDSKPTGNGHGKEKKAGGFAAILGKLGLGGAAAGSAGGGLAIGGGSAASGGFLAGLSANAGIVGATLVATVIGVGLAAISIGHAPDKLQNNRFFAKLGGDSAHMTAKQAAQAREKAMQTSGMDGDGISSSLQQLVDANSGAMGQLNGDADGVGLEAVDAKDAAASSEVPENTVQAPDNNWAGAAAKAAAGGAAGRKKLQKAAFKKKSSGASTKLAMGGSSAGTGRKIAGSSTGKATAFSTGRKAPPRSRSASRTRKLSGNSGARPADASAQLNAHNAHTTANAGGSSGPSPYSAVMDGSAGNIGSTGSGGSKIAGAGGASSGNNKPIVNPTTMANTKSEGAPPPEIKKKKDKTPYRKEMKTATIALMAATALILMASLVAQSKDPGSQKIAKVLAGLAFVAAAIALFAGVTIMTKHKQMMQGGMLAAGAGIIMIQSGMVLLKPDAGKAAQAGVTESQKAAQLEMLGKQGFTNPQNVTGQFANTGGNQIFSMTGPNGGTQLVQLTPTGSTFGTSSVTTVQSAGVNSTTTNFVPNVK